jgi:hypothetical protein
MVSQTRIDLLDIRSGSVIVKFRVNHDEDGRPPTLATVRFTMQQLVGVPIQIAGATVLQEGGVTIISGPVLSESAPSAFAGAPEQTLQQLQQEQMNDMLDLHSAAAGGGPGRLVLLAIAWLAVLLF